MNRRGFLARLSLVLGSVAFLGFVPKSTGVISGHDAPLVNLEVDFGWGVPKTFAGLPAKNVLSALYAANYIVEAEGTPEGIKLLSLRGSYAHRYQKMWRVYVNGTEKEFIDSSLNPRDHVRVAYL